MLSRLRASSRGLIGPTVFPVYMLALKAGLAITLAFTMVAAALGLTTADHLERGVVEIVIAFARRALLLFACTTLAFAAIDFWQRRWLLRTNWDPRRLPPVVRLEESDLAAQLARRDGSSVRRPAAGCCSSPYSVAAVRRRRSHPRARANLAHRLRANRRTHRWRRRSERDQFHPPLLDARALRRSHRPSYGIPLDIPRAVRADA